MNTCRKLCKFRQHLIQQYMSPNMHEFCIQSNDIYNVSELLKPLDLPVTAVKVPYEV